MAGWISGFLQDASGTVPVGLVGKMNTLESFPYEFPQLVGRNVLVVGLGGGCLHDLPVWSASENDTVWNWDVDVPSHSNGTGGNICRTRIPTPGSLGN